MVKDREKVETNGGEKKKSEFWDTRDNEKRDAGTVTDRGSWANGGSTKVRNRN